MYLSYVIKLGFGFCRHNSGSYHEHELEAVPKLLDHESVEVVGVALEVAEYSVAWTIVPLWKVLLYLSCQDMFSNIF